MTKTKSRFIFMSVIGLLIALSFKFLFHPRHDFEPEPENYPNLLMEIIAITIGTVIIWESNLQIDKWLNKKYSWLQATRKRLFAQIVTSTIFNGTLLTILLIIVHHIHQRNDEFRPPRHHGIDPLFFPAAFTVFAILLIEIGSQFFNAWKKSIIEVERYKTESANAQLQNLKNQLNPHFLFNNLSVLTSLIYSNQDKAVAFINELSKVYRYALDSKSAELVTLRKELDFLYHYIYLLKIRFDNSISFDFNIDEKMMSGYLPPMCLQMLVENTIQHNEASQAKPLQVSIYTTDNLLHIVNTIQKRSDETASSGMGLKNIQSRYSYFTDKKIDYSNDGSKFMVSLPLIQQK